MYECKECGHQVNDVSAVREHCERVHGDPECHQSVRETFYRCQVCEEVILCQRNEIGGRFVGAHNISLAVHHCKKKHGKDGTKHYRVSSRCKCSVCRKPVMHEKKNLIDHMHKMHKFNLATYEERVDRGGAELADWKEGCTFKCKSCDETFSLLSKVMSHYVSSGHGKGTADCNKITVRDIYPCLLCVPSESKTLNDHMPKKHHNNLVKCENAFDMIFTISVPNILERIFFSLDYESLKNCHKVCNKWRTALTSDCLKWKKGQVYLKFVQEEYKLNVTGSEKEEDEISLAVSSRQGDVMSIKNILCKGVDPNCVSRWSKRWSNTPLFIAVMHESGAEVLKVLLEAGADPNIPNNSEETPLYWATVQGEIGVVKLLLDAGADPNIANIHRETPLYCARMRGNVSLVNVLLAAGAH